MPPDEEFDGMLGAASQINDPELQELFGDPPTAASPPPETPPVVEPAAPQAPAASETTPADPSAPAETTQEASQAPETPDPGAPPTDPPAQPQEAAQTPPATPAEVVDPSDPRPEFAEIEVPEFKTVEEATEWAKTQDKRRRDMQAWADRQVHKANLGSQQAQQQLQQMQQQQMLLQQQVGMLTQHAMRPQEPQQQITQDDVVEAVRTRPDDTLEWLRQNVPDAVDFALAQVAEQHGMAEMTRLQRQLIQAEQSEIAHAQQAQLQQERAPEILREGFRQVLGSVREEVGAESFDSVSERVGKLCVDNMNELRDRQRNPNGVTPDAVAKYVMKQYVAAREERFAQVAAQPQQPRQLPAAEVVPIGSAGPGGAPPATDTGEALVDEMEAFQKSRQMDWG